MLIAPANNSFSLISPYPTFAGPFHFCKARKATSKLFAPVFQGMMHPSLGSSIQRCWVCRDPLQSCGHTDPAPGKARSRVPCRQLQATAAFPKPASSLWWMLPAICAALP